MSYSHLPPGMQHVERRELYENLQARLAYLQNFLEFGPADIEALRRNQPFIKSLIPSLTEHHFFAKILQQDITAQALITHNTTSEPDVDEDDFTGPNNLNIKNRNMFVRWYLTKMNSDPSTTQYWEYMNMVGAMHAGHHRRTPLHVDVIHFSALLGHVQTVLNDAIISSPTLPTAEKSPLVKAWGKLLWIQNDLFAKWHIKDGDQYDQTSTRASKLNADTSFAEIKDDEGRDAECPFQAMARLTQDPAGKHGYAYKQIHTAKRFSYSSSTYGSGIGSITSISSP
ncbi:Protoglobin-domain-containing protein [Massariosphaeria phaeospora]|uniref:Protoglobin-domain-containing protein n=1 Tax=Massariosphaeria phaeospora TaxID=100035 RepID=A0A7C8MFT1_9PLEO|nr:Protoglobin-domain-containing protein [Massariosphaeria phaeospora]